MNLADVAEQTKIKLSLLEGLERDDVSHWPRGIFRRSYVRAYAAAVGLDPEPVIREFLERHPDPDEDMRAVLEAASYAGGRPPTRLRFLVDTAIGALAGLRASQPTPAAGDASSPDARAAARRPALTRSDAPEPVVERDRMLALSGAADPADLLDRRGLAGPEPEAGVAHDDPDAERAGGEPEPDRPRSPAEPDLQVLAGLCTRLGRAADLGDVEPVLGEAARALDAVGLVLWIADPAYQALVPALAAGYPDDLLARLPAVRRDSDTALAMAFRSGAPCIVDSHDGETGAVSVPVTTPYGCAGVLAIELRGGAERRPSSEAFASILAAQLAALVATVPRAEAISA